MKGSPRDYAMTLAALYARADGLRAALDCATDRAAMIAIDAAIGLVEAAIAKGTA